MHDFSRRATTVEMMDSVACDFTDYCECLRDLERVNQLTLAYRPTLDFLRRLVEENRLPHDRPVKILDAGCGYGDMVRRIARWAQQRTIGVSLTGLDLDPRSARAAAEVTPPRCPVRWVTGDCLSYGPDEPVDVVVSSLLAHHLDDRTLVRFLAWMEATATIGWFVNDLHRHRLSYIGFSVWSRAARWHRFVQYDGPVSITRAFRPADWHHYLAAAGIPDGAAEIVCKMPFRLCVARVHE